MPHQEVLSSAKNLQSNSPAPTCAVPEYAQTAAGRAVRRQKRSS